MLVLIVFIVAIKAACITVTVTIMLLRSIILLLVLEEIDSGIVFLQKYYFIDDKLYNDNIL